MYMKQWAKKRIALALVTVMTIGLLTGIPLRETKAVSVGDGLTITGEVSEGQDYSYSNHLLTILSAKEMVISGTTYTDHIFIKEGIDANITLKNLTVNMYKDDETYTIASAVEIAENSLGNVTITLEGTNMLSALNNAAIQKNTTISAPGKLTITGSGNLTAISQNIPDDVNPDLGTKGAAGIGGSEGYSTGNITFAGTGTIAVSTDLGGAGIGGGYNGGANSLIIESGTIISKAAVPSALAGERVVGAGIGAGYNGSVNGITIDGGIITASSAGKGYSAGIGSSYAGNAKNIQINGGKVTATGDKYAAGIGNGSDCTGEYSYSTDIAITGGSITANGGAYAAGIGEGQYRGYAVIYISGGSVNAKGYNGAQNIGRGYITDADEAESAATTLYYSKTDKTKVTLSTQSGYTANAKVVPTFLKNGKLYKGYGTTDIYADDSGKLYLYLVSGVSLMDKTQCIDYFTIVRKNDGVVNIPDTVVLQSVTGTDSYEGTISGDGFVFGTAEEDSVFKVGTYDVYMDGIKTGKQISLPGETIGRTEEVNYYSVSRSDVVNGSITADTTALQGADFTFTVAADTGYEISQVTYTVNGVNKELTSSNGIYTIPGSSITGTITLYAVIVEQDLTGPTGSITIDGKQYTTLNTKTGFTHYKLASNNVTITADNIANDVKNIQYAIGNTVYTTSSDIDAAALNWTTVSAATASTNLSDNTNQVVYAKLTDINNNVTYISTVGIYNDTVAPSVSDVTLSASSGNAATSLAAAFAVGEKCTYYYTVYPASASAPDAATVKSRGTGNTLGGTGTLSAASSVSGKIISNLEPNTAYKLYVVAEDSLTTLTGTSSGNLSEVLSSDAFSTGIAEATVSKNPTVSGTYGSKVSDMTLTPGEMKDIKGNTLEGTWKIKSGGDIVPSVNDDSTCIVIFTPSSSQYAARTFEVTVDVKAKSISTASVKLSGSPFQYNAGASVTPVVEVTLDGNTLVNNKDYSISYEGNTTIPGTVKVIVTGTGNYKDTASADYTIEKGAQVLTEERTLYVKMADKGSSRTYNLYEMIQATEESVLGEISYIVELMADDTEVVSQTPMVNGSTLTMILNSSLTAGDVQKIKVTIKSTYYADTVTYLNLVVTDKTNLELDTDSITIPASTVYTGKSWSYTGSPVWKNGSETIADLATTITYAGSGNTVYASSATAPVDAGEYTVTFSVNTDTYVGEQKYNFRITTTVCDVSGIYWNYTSPFTYDGQSKSVALIVPEDLKNIVTATTSGDLNAVNTGTYTAVASFSVNSNYTIDTDSLYCTWKINKANYAGISWDPASFTYDGSIKQVSVSIPDNYKEWLSIKYSGNYAEVNAGNYTAEAVFDNSNSNYNTPSIESYNWSIEPEEIDLSGVSWNEDTFIYDGNKHTVKVVGYPNQKVVPTYTGQCSETEIGNYNAGVIFEAVSTNYTIKSGSFTANTHAWKIKDAGTVLTLAGTISAENAVYDGAQKNGYLIDGGSLTSLQWQDSNGEKKLDWTDETSEIIYEGEDVEYTSKTAPTQAGTYTVTFKVKGSVEGYSGSKTLTFTIAQKEYDMTGVAWNYIEPFTYDGLDKEVAVTGTLPEGVSILRYEGTTKAKETGTYTAKVVFQVADSVNCKVPVLADCTWVIKEKESAPGGDPGSNPGGGNSNPGNNPGGSDSGAGSGNVQPAVGTTQVIDGKTYTVTVSSETDGQVAFTTADKNAATVVIPATITVGNVNYKVTSISRNAFSGCKILKKVVIGSEIKEIPAGCFNGCKKLTNVTIGSNVTKIGDKAFYKCTALKKITIPKNVITIGKQAFYGAKALKTITIKSKVLSKVGSKAITGIHSKAVIKCPSKSLVTKYKKLFKSSTGFKKTMKIK
ncbi:MAG: leucine-rich repeat protein [Lachnospiraceae bacterium]